MKTELIIKSLLASKSKRLINYLIDFTFFYIVVFSVFMLTISILKENDPESVQAIYNYIQNLNQYANMILSSLLYATYMLLVEGALKGRSIGKLITKTKVVLEDGTQPDLNDFALRSICRVIPFNPISFIGANSRGWHDSLSQTYVIDMDKSIVPKKETL